MRLRRDGQMGDGGCVPGVGDVDAEAVGRILESTNILEWTLVLVRGNPCGSKHTGR